MATKKNAAAVPTKRSRTRYSAYVKEEVRKRYPFCRTTADKETLAAELGIVDDDGKPSVSKLYNLASRLGAAGSTDKVGELGGDSEHQLIHESPDTTKFTRRDDEYLKQEFGRRAIGDIAAHIQHSETAVLYRARHLKLRKPVKYWDVTKVAMWFAMSPEEFATLVDEGLDVYPLGNRRGRLTLELVSTSSIGRWMASKKNLKRLRDRGADEFFISEIQESLQDLIDAKTEFESCTFLSHGHICMNPATELSFGKFCTNNDHYKAGEDPVCRAKTLAIEDLRPTIP